MTTGIVYFVAYEDALIRELHPFLKIGSTRRDVASRLKELSTGSPLNLVCVGYILSDDSAQIELSLHRRFKKFAVRGEWIKVNPDILKYINKNFDIKENTIEAAFYKGIHEDKSREKMVQENAELKTGIRKCRKEIMALRCRLGLLKKVNWKTWIKSEVEL